MLQFPLHGLATGSIYALLALSFALVYRSTGIFHVSHGAAYAAAAYAAYLVRVEWTLPWSAAVLSALLAAALVNVTCDWFVYRPLQVQGASSLVLTLASFGSYLVFSNIISVFAGTAPKILRDNVDATVEFAGLVLTRTELLGLALCIVSTTLILGTVRLTKFGLRLSAFAQDEELYSVLGNEPLRPRYQLFLMSSVLAALAGLLVGLDRGMTPQMGLGAVFTAGVSALLGGANLLGVVFVALGLGVLQHFATWAFSAEWQDAITFGLLLAVAALRPRALLPATGPTKGL